MSMAVHSTDFQIEGPGGSLFMRRWNPEHADFSKPVIVMIHDSLGSVELWRDFPRRLASRTGLEVIAYDRLGFGRSDPSPAKISRNFIRDEARGALAAVCEAQHVTRKVLFGHSVGGAMAISAAASHGSEVEAVIAISAQSFVDSRLTKGITDAIVEFERPALTQRLERYHGEKAKWVLDSWASAWLGENVAEWSLDEDLKALRCPMLALQGSLDEYNSEAHLRRIAACASGPVDAVVLEGCGHFPCRDQPERVLELVAGTTLAL